MTATHERLYEKAIRAADRLHSDTSVPIQRTVDSLVALKDQVDMLLDAAIVSLRDDLTLRDHFCLTQCDLLRSA